MLDDPTGPHSSHTANVADPRVDSDRIGGAGNTASAGGYGTTGSGLTGSHGTTTHNTTGSGLTGTHGTTTHNTTGSGLTGSHGTTTHNTTGSGLTGSHSTTHGSDPTGPHDSKLANKLDPRVDSDRVGPAGNSASVGGYGNETHSSGQHTYQTDGKKLPDAILEDKSRADHHSGAGLTHSSHANTGSGLTGSNTYGSDPTGPHDSRLANKADPRVDSDRYGAAGNTAGAGGYGSTGSGLTGSHTGSNTYGSDPTGPHNTHLANQADPRVDSDRYGGQGNTYGTTQGSGLTGTNHPGHVGNPNANKTAGPHGSDILNKLDPRVDSNLDGSKKVGGDRTYG